VLALLGAGVSVILMVTETNSMAFGFVTNTTTHAPYAYLAMPLVAIGSVLVVVSLAMKE